MKINNCDVPEDCWTCIKFDKCPIIDQWKRARGPDPAAVGIITLLLATALGTLYVGIKWIQAALTYSPF